MISATIDYQKFVDLVFSLIRVKGHIIDKNHYDDNCCIEIDKDNTDIPMEIVSDGDFLDVVNTFIGPYRIFCCSRIHNDNDINLVRYDIIKGSFNGALKVEVRNIYYHRIC
jgi:hypothetical protein